MKHDEIKGFTDQGERNKALVNENKVLEEQVLRQIDKLKGEEGLDQRHIALSLTKIQEAFMWMNRGIFQPQRLSDDLPDAKLAREAAVMEFAGFLSTQDPPITVGSPIEVYEIAKLARQFVAKQ